MKILIVNSDSPNNRGDRAILKGGIKLIKQRFTDADIWSLSERQERDQEWFEINFLPMATHTINPFNLLRLGLFAKKCDIIFWGGGELLKDYTNKLGLMYWVLKILFVKIFNEKIYGFYQGIGPTKSKFSRKLIVFIVNRTKHFFVRDEESFRKLQEWGVKTPVTSSFDPAVLCRPQPLVQEELDQLSREYDITLDFLNNSIGIGARNWFHYRTNAWIPFRFLRMIGFRRNKNLHQSELYKANLAKFCDILIDRLDVNVTFFPMHTSIYENDAGFSRQVRELMKNRARVRIIAEDMLSPQTFHNSIGSCRAFIGYRLHSFILATTAYIPAMVFYYVDKGRIYADQVGISNYCWPIEDMLRDETILKSVEMISDLIANFQDVGNELADRLDKMRTSLIAEFNEMVN